MKDANFQNVHLISDSCILNKLHDQFQYFLASYDTKIVTFAECKCTKISTLGIDVHIVPPEFSCKDLFFLNYYDTLVICYF